jgi:iron(III) transport system ATP-binding protein
MTPLLKLEGVSVERGGRLLLDDLTLEIQSRTILALTGPSGSGKTTLLRVIVGLEPPSRGRVLLFGKYVSDSSRILTPPEDRRIAMVFQDLGLWPHMNVAEHLAFPLAAQRVHRSERAARIGRMLRSVGLEGLERQRPATLSGGERQRLAIARALVINPQIVLLDEPLANVDVVLKSELLGLFRGLMHEHAATAICVTHNPWEALALTHDFAVLERGRIVQRGDFGDLRRAPATDFVQSLAALNGQV